MPGSLLLCSTGCVPVLWMYYELNLRDFTVVHVLIPSEQASLVMCRALCLLQHILSSYACPSRAQGFYVLGRRGGGQPDHNQALSLNGPFPVAVLS